MVELPVDGDINYKKWALIVNVNPGCYFGGSATQYFICLLYTSHQFIPSLQQGQFFVDDFVASVVGYSRIRFVVDEQRTFLCFHKEG